MLVYVQAGSRRLREILLSLAIAYTFTLCSSGTAFAREEAEQPKGRAQIAKKIERALIEEQEKEADAATGDKKKLIKESKPAAEEPTKQILWASPYAKTEELMLPLEITQIRRTFTTTDPLHFGGRIVEEQALFEELARRDEETLYYAAKEVAEKPWWRDLLESFSGILQYKQGLYTNYFNNRATDRLLTEAPFVGLRMKRWGLLSADMNYFGNFERISFEPRSIDPHVIKTHGGQGRLLYRPSRRFHLLMHNNVRKSDKIVGVEGVSNNVSIGNNTVSDTVGAELRYFFTQRNVLDLNFNYDYSRTASQDALRISRGYEEKISFLRSFGSRLILRGFFLFDYLKTTAPSTATTTTAVGTDTAKFTSFRYEPGLGATLVLTRRVVLDADFSKQRVRSRGSDTTHKGNRLKLDLNHKLTNRLSHGWKLTYSDLEGKRSSISTVNGESDANFESVTAGGELSYRFTPLIKVTVVGEYTHTDPNTPDAKANNRKKASIELSRRIRKNGEIVLNYTFDQNFGALGAEYTSHTGTITFKSTFGAGGK